MPTKKKITLKGIGWNLLLPYKPIMLVMLQKKGVPVPDHNTEKVARSFYQHIIKGNNYEGFDFENQENFVDPITASVIIKAVIELVKSIKKKKDEGKPLTDEETKLLNTANQVSEVVKDNVKEEAEGNIGKMILEYWWVIALGLIAFLYFRKGKAE